ncbi:DNA topoisomerase-1 [Caloranaerobacter azorensis DSM 13643]|uniref:DNA topoisomerase 1 n=1 Tax=Caloranaerobacter azorensis DSM 13643 TaxID=1121264 RepID=A0A1M5RNI0_9FIRM|nr:type I DNA topoisomerase [Caloranaerobacter azorensis]SHH27710.1 DNA topoisomerase-1 [Caloranaerobacter azorensis DSM 13643]
MAKFLVIVESPAKAKTIGKFLGSNYKVKASVGHVRDLPKSKLGIKIEENFEPEYITIRGKGPVINEIKKEAKKADKIYLATDPDREGEAISWHLSHILGLSKDDKVRIEFNEITKNAIKNAIKKPRQINQNLVDAQQARRILDRLVGYKISPLLWRKVKRGLSAGRVQSVATKLICDREKEIENFKPTEYWTLDAFLEKNNQVFKANFYGVKAEGKERKLELKSKDDVEAIVKEVKMSTFTVEEIKKGNRKRNPSPPFTTSTLQQEASKRLGFSTKKTMMIAQQLYEGIDIKGEGTVGLITYIRTDSVRISDEALKKAKDFIVEIYGEKYTTGIRKFKSKRKNDIQDAHEAIRPTLIDRTPEKIKGSLSVDQYKLYKLIWERFIASQMSPALYETLSVKISAGKYIFKASGSKIVFDGYLKIFKDDKQEKEIEIPNLNEGESVNIKDIQPEQHFTQPPARYTESTLVKTLEELGIGRPSTYAPTISTILSRGYVVLENKYFKPTDLGILVTELLLEYFTDIINEEFTADMESKLDKIEEGVLNWRDVINEFYQEFKVSLEKAENEINKIEIQNEVTDIKCEKCGRFMVIKHGRFGKFLACPGYPECKNTKPIVKELGVKCPECGGELIERHTKKGRKFYGCSNYPDCSFVSWDIPTGDKCPECGGILVKKKNKKGTYIVCSNKECKYKKETKEE